MKEAPVMVTVVVPVYNMEKYMDRAIESLLVQTYTDYEILLVDDGSTDQSPGKCDAYAVKYPGISVIHKPNGGLSSARNCGIEHANGRYIIFPDPDDWVDEDYLERLVTLQQQYPDKIVATGHYISYDNHERKNMEKDQVYNFDRDTAMVNLMLPDYYCGFAVNKLLNLEVIRDSGLRFDEELGMAQDLHFMVRYFPLLDGIVYDSKPSYHYYQESGGVTHAGLTARRVSGLKTYRKIAAITREKNPTVADMALCTMANLSMSMLESYYKTEDPDPTLLKELRENIRENKKLFMKSNKGLTRKIELLIADISPKGYVKLRNLLRR